MNRMEEYEALMARLEEVPQTDPVAHALERQKRERTRSRRIWRPLATVAAVFCVFVGMINLSPTVSAVCREIPFLEELVEMLTFNPSLRIAIEHDYVQMMEQEQTKDGVTARVEYLIVDQKQVNVFYTLSSEIYTALDATPDVFGADGQGLPVGISYGGIVEDQEELRQITIDFVEEDVPDYMKLTLKLVDHGSYVKEEPLTQVGEEDLPQHDEPEFFTELSFDLHFDPKFTAQGKTVDLNKTVELDGQKITVTDMEVYPTHIRINVEEDASNTAWLTSLRFYLELEDGNRIETISNGIFATGSTDSPSMVSYRAESSYFYEAECIRLCITSADFLDKEREEVHIDLKTLESDPLPQGVKLWSAVERKSGMELTFLVEETGVNHVQVLSSTYYDMEGNEYHCGSWGTGMSYYDEASEEQYPGWGYETYYLEDFYEKEGIFKVHYTHFWIPDEPVIVELTAE